MLRQATSTRTAILALFFCICLAARALAQSVPTSTHSAPERPLPELRWRCIGPFRGGRTVGAVGIPTQPNVFYVGVNNGGVWRTNDSGRVWKPIFDAQETQSIGALAVAPSDPNVIYVGSGEGLQRPDLSTGDGIYRSTDGGASWRHLGLRDGQQIGALLVDPRDARRIFVAVLGHPYGANQERGVFRSTDGGESFTKSLYKDADTGAIALAFDPVNPDTLYASLWAARMGPWENGVFSGAGSGLFKSTDSGSSWRPLRTGLPTIEQGLGRIGFAVAPSDPKRLYAVVEAGKEFAGLFRSDDAGESWKKINSEKRVSGRASDFAEVKVHPTNPDVLFVANTSLYRSRDGGLTFIAIKGAPGGDDYHTLWINPANPSILLLAGDQGAAVSVNDGESWSSWYNQPTAQLYHVSTDNRFPYWVYGGQQESGSAAVASRGDEGAITFREWHSVGAEEYGYVEPDPLDPDVVYGGKLTRFRHSTHDAQNVSPAPLKTDAYRFLRTAPLAFSKVDPHVLYFAGQVLFKTVNGGASWEVISPDLSRETPGVPVSVGIYRTPALEKSLREKRRGVIYSVAPSPLDGGLIWAGTDDGLIHVTRNGGKSWADVTPKELTPWSKVSILEASHFDAQTAFAAVNRIRLDDQRPHIYRTRDGGKSWKEIVLGLPAAPVNAVREDPIRKGLLFAATERGVHVSFDEGEQWRSLQLNLPASSVRDLVVHEDDLVVATHGRSFWILDDFTPLRQPATLSAPDLPFLFPPQIAHRIRQNRNTDTPLPPDEPAGENPPDGAILDYFLAKDARGPVVLEILDASGTLVRRYTSGDVPEPVDETLNIPTYWIRPPQLLSARSGMHRFVWDLRGPAPDALEHEYPIAARYHDTPRGPRGPLVLPGNYTARLTVDGKAFSQPLLLKMDPRVKTPLPSLEKAFDLAVRICAAMHVDFQAIQKTKELRRRLKETSSTKDDGKLERELAALESGEANPSGSAKPISRDLEKINSDLVSLLAVVDGADAGPTAQIVAGFAGVEKDLSAALLRLEEIDKAGPARP